MRELTLDVVAHLPPPGVTTPTLLRFSPDGRLLTFLYGEEGSLQRQLFALDLSTGERRVFFAPTEGATEENLSPEEKLRRERERQMMTGVTSYAWAEDADVMLVPLRGELWVIEDGDARRVGANAIDPQLSPDGKRIAFVRDSEVWTLDVASGEEHQLTFDAEPGVTNGLAEYVAQEEMHRMRGHWWSLDGARLAYEQADERHIPEFHIPHWGTDSPAEETHRYPFAGAANARVRIGVLYATGGETRWLDLGDPEYVCHVHWHPDGRLFVQTMDRDQTRLDLLAVDVTTGALTTLLTETSESWVNLHQDLRFVPPTGEFVWASERTGTKQLYLYGRDGSLVRALTSFGFPIDSVVGFDPDARLLAFTAATTPVEQQVYTVSLDGGEPARLTQTRGMHSGAFARGFTSWVEISHSIGRPPRVDVRGDREANLHEPPAIDVALVTPELFTFPDRDGVMLHGLLYRPARIPAPLIVNVYGGPHAQTVLDSWGESIDLRAQYLAAQGFVVMSVDNRGSARRGLEFESAILKRMGTVEIDDQVDGVRYAQSQGWVDGDRAGIYGWSYGGYMTIMCMLKAPDVFKVGVAGAPVTSWDGYDTFYTERYMRTPQANPDGYRDGAAMTYADQLRGKLMIIHGMIDENVHFRHTARFLRALAEANKPVDLLLYPEERHSPRSERDRRNMEQRIVEHFRGHL